MIRVSIKPGAVHSRSLGSQCVPLLLVANKRHIKRNWSQKAISYLQKAKGCLLKTKESKAEPND